MSSKGGLKGNTYTGLSERALRSMTIGGTGGGSWKEGNISRGTRP